MAPSIGLLAIPVINRPDLLERCIASIDHPVTRLLVIDNSGGGIVDGIVPPACVGEMVVTVPPANLGVAASWNHAIRTHPHLDWWAIANADTEFAPGDLARLATEMAQGGPRWVGMVSDWRVFGLSRDAVRVAGLFDENHHPIYVEDCDYEYRCDLAGVPRYFLPGTSQHEGSVAIRSDGHYAERNDDTHSSNRLYHIAKWGGHPRGGERFTTPFDRGGSVRDWTLDIDRLRDNTW